MFAHDMVTLAESEEPRSLTPKNHKDDHENKHIKINDNRRK